MTGVRTGPLEVAVVHTGLLEAATHTEGWTHKEALELEDGPVSRTYSDTHSEMDAYCYRLLLISPFRGQVEVFREQKMERVTVQSKDGWNVKNEGCLEMSLSERQKERKRGRDWEEGGWVRY